jgi:hypothetical protein
MLLSPKITPSSFPRSFPRSLARLAKGTQPDGEDGTLGNQGSLGRQGGGEGTSVILSRQPWFTKYHLTKYHLTKYHLTKYHLGVVLYHLSKHTRDKTQT